MDGEIRARSSIVEPIEAGLGSVTVTGFGDLHSVDLNVETLRHTNERELAQAVTTAVQRAALRARGGGQ